MKLICERCTKEFESLNKKNKYCSQSCSKESRSEKLSNKEYARKCPVCNKEFVARNYRAIFCSNSCKSKDFKENNKVEYIHICKHCNKEFISFSKDTTFCSISCASKNKNEKGIDKKYLCKNCGIEFNQKNKRHYFCSDNCKIIYGTNHVIMKIVKCSNCSKELARINSLKNDNYYCSKECEISHRSNLAKDTRICEYCEKEFICCKGETLRFCSTECQGKWQSEYRVGKNSSTYKLEITDEMRIKKCEFCGNEMVGTPKSFETNKFCSKRCKLRGNPKTLTKPHRNVLEFLIENNYNVENEYPISKYFADIHFLETNMVIEVNGTYWHSDVRFYSEKDKMISLERDRKKKIKLINKGYKILYLWEHDIINNFELCKNIIIEFVKNNGKLNNYHSMNYEIKNDKLKLIDNILVPHFEK